MTIQLERFRIEGLHGNRDVDIAIRDNKLILVGENGTGKSTIANFIFFFLANEWRRMISYNFVAVSMTINGEELRFERRDLLSIELTPPAKSRLELNPRILRALSRIEVEYTAIEIIEGCA